MPSFKRPRFQRGTPGCKLNVVSLLNGAGVLAQHIFTQNQLITNPTSVCICPAKSPVSPCWYTTEYSGCCKGCPSNKSTKAATAKNFTDSKDERKSNFIYKESDKLSGRPPIEFVQATSPIVPG